MEREEETSTNWGRHVPEETPVEREEPLVALDFTRSGLGAESAVLLLRKELSDRALAVTGERRRSISRRGTKGREGTMDNARGHLRRLGEDDVMFENVGKRSIPVWAFEGRRGELGKLKCQSSINQERADLDPQSSRRQGCRASTSQRRSCGPSRG
jgi:hypothetical protein